VPLFWGFCFRLTVENNNSGFMAIVQTDLRKLAPWSILFEQYFTAQMLLLRHSKEDFTLVV